MAINDAGLSDEVQVEITSEAPVATADKEDEESATPQ